MSELSKTVYASYRQFHLWMLLPFFISVLGFSYSYYLYLSDATFHQHVHGVSATLWFMLVILQPYLITRKHNVQWHRSLGTIGVMLAGVVAGSALTIIPKNTDNIESLDVNDFFNPTFAYFATVIDIVLILMFIVSVSLAVLSIKQRNLADHVQWLMASVFFVLSPALLRLIGIAVIFLNEGSVEGFTMVDLALPTMIMMLVLITIFYSKFGSFKHLSFQLLVICHLSFLFIRWVGDNEFIRALITVIFKP